MKLKDFLEIIYYHERLSLFDNNDNFDYLLHKVKKDEIIEKYPELLNREIYNVGIHWYKTDEATLGIVLL